MRRRNGGDSREFGKPARSTQTGKVNFEDRLTREGFESDWIGEREKCIVLQSSWGAIAKNGA